MPTYEYVCDGCGHEFELFQSMSDRVRRTCPECGEPTLRRLIGTGGGIIFKGSGFFATDYRSESYKKAAAAEKKKKDDGTKDKKDDKPRKPESGGKPSDSSGGGE